MSAPTPPEVDAATVEKVARAICESDGEVWLGDQGPFCEGYRANAVAAIAALPVSPAEALRDILRVHHPIMRSETGPFSGCRCGQVKLGQDVIGHVTDRLHAALAPQAEGHVCDGGCRR